jgi:hypothetical protein
MWTGSLESSDCSQLSVVAAHFRVSGNSGKLRTMLDTLAGDEEKHDGRCVLSAWSEHCDCLSEADLLRSSLNDRFLSSDPRHACAEFGEECGFAGPVGLNLTAAALEVQSLSVFHGHVRNDIPPVSDSDESLSFYYSFTAMATPNFGQVKTGMEDLTPAAAPRRSYTTDVYPMLRRFAAHAGNEQDLRGRNSEDLADRGSRRFRLRSAASFASRNHYSSLGLSASTTSWLLSLQIPHKRTPC